MIAARLLLVSCLLLFAEQSFLVMANPSSVDVPENPDKNQPIITIGNLKNDSTLNVSSVSFSFTVHKPSSWFSFNPVHGDLISISYILDGKITEVASKGLDADHYSSNTLTYTAISELSDGNHSLHVYVRSVSYYLDPNRPAENSTYGWWMYPPANYFMNTYSNINFTVNTTLDSQTVSPTAAIPEFPPWTISLLLSLMAAFVGLLFYLKKRKL